MTLAQEATAQIPAFCEGIRYFGDPWPEFDRLGQEPAVDAATGKLRDPGSRMAAYQTLLYADALRYLTLQMTASKASGHPGGFASQAEAYAALVYLGQKNIPTEVGHHAPGFYAAMFLDGSLSEMGIHTVADLQARFREREGLLGHLSGYIPGRRGAAGPRGPGGRGGLGAPRLVPARRSPGPPAPGGRGG
ncbi:phosphoketolase, partial [Synechococcus sp. W60.2]